MDILAPPRLHTYEPRTVVVVLHTDPAVASAAAPRTLQLKQVFPFETVFGLKQRIAVAMDTPDWLPSKQYIALAASEGQYTPLEFTWPFAATLSDPFSPEDRPDARIYEDGARKPVLPTLVSGVTLETLLPPTAATVHVWNLAGILKAAGTTPALLSNELFDGWVRLYFPTLRNTDDATRSAAATNTGDVLKTYREFTDARLQKIETLLGSSGAAPTAVPFRLKELRSLRYALPVHPGIRTQSLLLLFYGMRPTERLPFLRFFPADGRTAPIVKLAKLPNGTPVIGDARVLSALMMDQPSNKLGDVLLLKAPLRHPRAPLGACWTLRVFEDGSAELHVGAPRRDAELQQSIMTAAMQEVSGVLEDAGWPEDAARRLLDISATYTFASGLRKEKAPSKSQLRARYEMFAPLFLLDARPSMETAAVTLRYKAVSNYSREISPVAAFISHLFLHEEDTDVATALVREFGLTTSNVERAIEDWDAKYRELMETREKKVVAAHSMGASVGIVNRHPTYEFVLAGVESEVDLLRILAALALYVTQESAADEEAAAAAPEAKEAAQEAEAAEVAAEDAYNFMEYYGTYGEEDGEAAEEAPVAAVAPVAPGAVAAAPVKPLVGAFGDDVLPKFEYLERLRQLDPELFAYTVTDKRFTVYSRCCQKSSDKQPNVLTPESYANALRIYGNAVFWVEVPLPAEDVLVTQMAARTPGEREKMLRAAKKTPEEMLAIEKRALQLGFPLKEDAKNGYYSISELTDKKGPKYPFSPESLEELRTLKTAQQQKPLWIIVRAGSIETKPNYYICAEYWCVHNDLPLLPAEFTGTVTRDGRPKAANTCPFCAGTLLDNPNVPKPGQTVLQRGVTSGGKSIAKYAGYLSTIQHPDTFPLPCCFASPDSLQPPEGSYAVPASVVDIPDTVVPPPAETVVMEAVDAAAPAPAPAAERVEMPFSPVVLTAAAKRVQNRMYIPSQIVLGRTTQEWFELEKGTIGVPPPAVNTLLGQNPERFLTKNKGAMAEKINSKLAVPATAFIRYGIGTSKRTPGTALLSLLAFAKYATAEFKAPGPANRIPTQEEVLEDMFGTQAVAFAHAFEQANYGTLVHEFSKPGAPFPESRTGEFLDWCRTMSMRVDGGQRPYAEQVFQAWSTFEAYVRDVTVAKELRLWEGLLSVPGLLTETACILVRIVHPKSSTQAPRIVCPEFGIPAGVRDMRPPLLFILEDEQTGLYDPLVLYDGKSDTEKHLLGVISDAAPAVFDALSPEAREPLTAFLAQYYSDSEGCGRTATPMHPWMPERSVDSVPKLGEFARSVGTFGLRIESLLRDRSNRLVGALVRQKPYDKSPLFYIPLRDDGTVLPHIPSHRGEEALPLPPLDALLHLLAGGQQRISDKIVGSAFPGLVPARLVADKDNYVAVDLRCGATVPIAPLARSASVKSVRFAELKRAGVELKGDAPWMTDVALLGAPVEADVAAEEDAVKRETDEEHLEEAYAHLRISLSVWLNGSAEGRAARQQIELLRQARRRLPLYELQKRLDILLHPFVAHALRVEAASDAATASSASLLRKDCLQIQTQEGCDGACTWSGGRCLIHATGTSRALDPVRVLTARLTDEFLRTFGAAQKLLAGTVSRLRPMQEGAVVEEDGALLFAGHGRADTDLFDVLGYSKRKVGAYTQGFVYPEEVAAVAAAGVETPVRMGALPADWVASLRYPTFSAEVARDPRQRFEAVLLQLLGTPVPPTLRGTREEWAQIGERLDAYVIRTQVVPETGLLAPVEILQAARRAGGAAAAAPTYIVLDGEGVPLQHVRTGAFRFSEDALPTTLRAWVDAAAT